jgi:hypothetical protein
MMATSLFSLFAFLQAMQAEALPMIASGRDEGGDNFNDSRKVNECHGDISQQHKKCVLASQLDIRVQ